jgi:DNA-binding NtrC family response regulator
VLFIGNNPSDEWDISATLAPRGYKLLLAGTAEAGIHQLRSNSRDIGLVLIDPRLPGTQAMPQLALKASPGARVFVLGPAHTRAELVSLLLENI